MMQKQLLTKAKREMFKCSNIHWGHFSTPRYARTLLYGENGACPPTKSGSNGTPAKPEDSSDAAHADNAAPKRRGRKPKAEMPEMTFNDESAE